MSFGKRTREERQAVPSSTPGNEGKGDSDWGGLPVWQRRLLVGTLGGLAAVALVLLIGKDVQRAVLGAPTKVPFEAEKLVFDLPVASVSDDQVAYNTALRDECLNYPGEVADGPSNSGEAVEWQSVDKVSGRVTHSFLGADEVLACLATKQMPRLCKSSERDKLATMLTDYARAHDEFAKRVKDMVNTPGAVANAGQTAEMTPLSSGDTEAIKDETGVDLEFSPWVLSAVKTASQGGYLSSADFKSVPDALAPYLLEALEKPCQ